MNRAANGNGNGGGSWLRWERVLIAVLTAIIGVYVPYSTSERADICGEVRELRADVIDVLYQPGADIPRDFRDRAENVLRRPSC